MSKFQVNLCEESRKHLETVTADANFEFKLGTVTLSDVVCEMILQSRIDVRALQTKHTNVRKSLRLLAARKDIDLDSAIEQLLEMKGKSQKKNGKQPLLSASSAT